MKVFIAGPMQGIREWNAPAFDRAYDKLEQAGYNAYNPAAQGVKPNGWRWPDYLASSLTELVQCDGIALLPGWQNSEGARLEHHVANALGLFIIPLDQYGEVAW